MKLRDFIHSQKWTWKDAANRFGVPVSTLGGWLSGRRKPTLANLATIETVTELSVTARDFSEVAAPVTVTVTDG